jgi:hypothetical protein
LITLEFELVYPGGQPGSESMAFELGTVSGSVFTPTGMVDSSSGEAVEPFTLPVGTVYQVTEQLVAGSLAPWHLTVLHASVGGIQQLAASRPTP